MDNLKDNIKKRLLSSNSTTTAAHDRKKNKADSDESDRTDTDLLLEKLLELLQDDRIVYKFVNSITELVIPKIQSTIDDLCSEVLSLKKVIKSKDDKIAMLENKTDELEQYQRREGIRISGIPEREGEDPDKLIIEMPTIVNNNTDTTLDTSVDTPDVDEYEDFCTVRKETVQLLYETADELDELARKVRISTIAGSAGGIASAGLIIGGVVGAFFTFGGSLALTAAGAGLGVASAATTVGASIADSLISKNRQAQINEALQKDNAALEKLFNQSQTFPNAVDQDCEQDQRVVHGVASTGKAAILATDTSRVAVCVMRGAGRAVAVGGLVVSVILLPLDIASLVVNSKAIHEEKPHQLAEHFRHLGKQLTDNLRDDVMPCLFDETEFFLENGLDEYAQY